VAVVDPPMVDVLPDKPRTRGIARTKAGKARTATRSVAARCAGVHESQEPKINWTQPESQWNTVRQPKAVQMVADHCSLQFSELGDKTRCK